MRLVRLISCFFLCWCVVVVFSDFGLVVIVDYRLLGYDVNMKLFLVIGVLYIDL